jgi:hypothetical protein
MVGCIGRCQGALVRGLEARSWGSEKWFCCVLCRDLRDGMLGSGLFNWQSSLASSSPNVNAKFAQSQFGDWRKGS